MMRFARVVALGGCLGAILSGPGGAQAESSPGGETHLVEFVDVAETIAGERGPSPSPGPIAAPPISRDARAPAAAVSTASLASLTLAALAGFVFASGSPRRRPLVS